MTTPTASDTKAFYEGKVVELWEQVWAPAKGHLHMALFESPDDPIAEAMERATATMAAPLSLTPASEVLEVACGLGATARYLAMHFGCKVLATNISETQIAATGKLNREAGLADLISVDTCDFADLPYADARFDLWWCQESLVHAEDKARVLRETRRVLKPGGHAVLSALTLREEVPEADRQRIYERIHAPSMWSGDQHQRALEGLGFEIMQRRDWGHNVARTYRWVLAELEKYRGPFHELLGEDGFAKMTANFQLWIDRAEQGDVGWSYILARKPES